MAVGLMAAAGIAAAGGARAQVNNPFATPATITQPGSIVSQTLNAAFGPPRVDVRNYHPGTFGTGNSQPLSSFYGTGSAGLTAAQRVYSFVTALTQETDACAIQLAHNTLAAIVGGVVSLPACTGVVNFQLSINAGLVRIEGVHNQTLLLTGGCGTTPAVHSVSGSTGTESVWIKDVGFCALAGRAAANGFQGMSSYTPGAAHTNYLTGSSALLIDNDFNGGFERCDFRGYDRPVQLTNNAYTLTFDRCDFICNNYGMGFGIVSGATNLGEAITFRGGTSSNNNYGFDVGFISGVSLDCYLKDVRLDYNNVAHVRFNDPAGVNSTSFLHISAGHQETDNAHSGINQRWLLGGGGLVIDGPQVSEQGVPATLPANVSSAPSGSPPGLLSFTDATGASGSARIINCSLFMSQNVPLCYQADSATHDFDAHDNLNRYPNLVVIKYSSPLGMRVQQDTKQQRTITTAGGLPLDTSFWDRETLLNPAAGTYLNLQVAPDSTYFAAPGTWMRLVVMPNVAAQSGQALIQVYGQSGVTLVTRPATSPYPNAGTQYINGNTPAGMIILQKTETANTWNLWN